MKSPKIRIFNEEFKVLKAAYQATKYPIILCHGLLGFSEIQLPIGGIFDYWGGLKKVLTDKGATVYSPEVPPLASIATRAQVLHKQIKDLNVKRVNLIGHSMGGLDARYLISQVARADSYKILSLTTLASPHRGSPLANHYAPLGQHLPSLFGALADLSTDYMCRDFNAKVQNDPDVAYYSYGAMFKPTPMNILRLPWQIIYDLEGDNDGMVSVTSSQWGTYEGTLSNCDHLDVINMDKFRNGPPNTNFKAAAMYLHIMDTLAKKGF